jgi:arylsulfatase A-like enzyme
VAARPNILWLLSDQHRADVIGAAGHPVVRTPRLDALAASGTLFEDAYCQGPLCMPSRASMLTGRYVRDHGVSDNKSTLASGWPTMVQSIRDAGYQTAAIGKMHLYPHRPDVADGLPAMHGYGFDYVNEIGGKLASRRVRSGYTDYLAELGLLDVYRQSVRQSATGSKAPMWTVGSSPLPVDAYIDNWVADQAAAWLAQADSQRPFFLWVGFPGPHNPWEAPARFVEQYAGADLDLDTARRPELPADGPLRQILDRLLSYSSSATLTEERIRQVRRYYFANVTLIDTAIGRILDALYRHGRDHDTWVVYSTDHGEMLGSHGLLSKMIFYEPAVRVPLIIRPPGGRPGHRGGWPGQRGGAAKRRISGLVEQVDLVATLVELAGAAAIPQSPGRSLTSALKDGPWSGREVVVSENYGFGMWRTGRYKLVLHESDQIPVQLFDLAEDPHEDRNVVAEPGYQRVLTQLIESQARPFLAGGNRAA